MQSPPPQPSKSAGSRSYLVGALIGVVCFLVGLLGGIVLSPTMSFRSAGPESEAAATSAAEVAAAVPNPRRSHSVFVGYMDRVHNAAREVRWMYFSALGSGVTGDIVLLGHPELGDIVPPFCTVLRGENATVARARAALAGQTCFAYGGVVTRAAPANITTTEIPCPVRCIVVVDAKDDPDAVRLAYPFLRSLYFQHHPVIRELLTHDYEYVLRGDLDVFFTPRFAALRPPPGVVAIGAGAYVHSDSLRRRLRRIAKDLKLHHIGMHNVGATWYGRAATILPLVDLARTVTIHILETQFKAGPGVWPEWWRGVSS